MYRIELNVGPTDFAVSRVIKDFNEQGKSFTRKDIADMIRASEITVHRSCGRLIKAGIVRQLGSSRTGYSLQYVGEKAEHA